jgi:hypothetical protein
MPIPLNLPVVRALGQFGPMPKYPTEVKLFLDDARNPPLKEKGWVVVRTVEDAIWFMREYGDLVSTLSLDNDLNQDREGYHFLQWILDNRTYTPKLTNVIIHTGNDPKARLMRRMLLGLGFLVKRRIPSTRIYPNIKEDKRVLTPFVARGKCEQSTSQ